MSYTGTTWFNLVLASHPRAFAIGPPDRPLELGKAQAREICRVHGAECTFWPRFFDRYDPQQNPFVEIARFAERETLVINNPVPAGAGALLNHPDIEVRWIQLVRDGRAVAASYHRKFPETSFLDGVRTWLQPAWASFHFDPDDPDLLSLRYEDIVASPRRHLKVIGDYVGLDYDDSALRFWEHEHHPGAGSVGTLTMVKLAQGVAVEATGDHAFYAEQLERLKADPEASFRDDRWRTELSRRDLFVFDHLCGSDNERFGYERDRFTVTEMETFARELHLALAPARGGAAARDGRRLVTVPSALSLGPGAPGLRQQLMPAWILNRGLSLTPSQVRKMAALAAGALITVVVLVALLTALVLR